MKIDFLRLKASSFLSGLPDSPVIVKVSGGKIDDVEEIKAWEKPSFTSHIRLGEIFSYFPREKFQENLLLIFFYKAHLHSPTNGTPANSPAKGPANNPAQ